MEKYTMNVPSNDDMVNTFRNDIIQVMKNNVCKISFVKVGTDELREMICTLRPDLLPEGVEVTESKKKENLDVIAVYDLENNGWRSFRIENLMTLSVATNQS
jgi:hypothetical protein